MQQDTNQQPDGQHLLDQIVLPAMPPEFHYADIARQYGDGEFANRLDAEIEDILRNCQGAGESRETATLTLSSEALATLRELHCVALIQDGQVLPLLDIEQRTAPMTALQRARLYHAAARTLLEAIAAIYEDRGKYAKRQDDDNEGDPCAI
jgi:hypothetical protein